MYESQGDAMWMHAVDPSSADLDERTGREATFSYFRTAFDLPVAPERYDVRICADSRYKIVVNGVFVAAGPCKNDASIRTYDIVDLAAALRRGRNVIAVTVLHYPVHGPGNHSVATTATPGLWVRSCDALPMSLSSGGHWKAIVDPNRRIVGENPFFAPLQILEEWEPDATLRGWDRDADAPADSWPNALVYDQELMPPVLRPDALAPRPIPPMASVPGAFPEAMMLPVVVDAGDTCELLFDAGEETTAYLHLAMSGGTGARVELLCAESYALHIPEHPSGFDDHPVKGDRTDAEHGALFGYADHYTVAGYGTADHPETYEPFWWRTFRYLRVRIVAGPRPLTVLGCDYTSTAYPLDMATSVDVDDPDLLAIRDISERTLRCCMHETYEDCPFYEQMQYAMDARSQMLYTYATAADDRLARHCMETFRLSQLGCGLLNGSAPNNTLNVIPGFSIYYIGMLHDHMMWFGDRDLLRRHMDAMSRILAYFEVNRRADGLVGHIGGVDSPEPQWSFVDWADEWLSTRGVPPAVFDGPLTIESLMYVLGLRYAADLYGYLGDAANADGCRDRAESVTAAVNRLCRDDDGMYRDGPTSTDTSQHCQVFAVLAGACTSDEGRRLLTETLDRPHAHAQCTVAMTFYLFRALERCGLYGRTRELWRPWRDMLANHMTTCAEDMRVQRSDCHAWGALALYELPCAILGVRPAAPGYAKAMVSPQETWLPRASGSAVTPRGAIRVSWRSGPDGRISVKADGPADVEIVTDGVTGRTRA